MEKTSRSGLFVGSMRANFGYDFPVEELRRHDAWQKAVLEKLYKPTTVTANIGRTFEQERVDRSNMREIADPKSNFIWIALGCSSTACALSLVTWYLFNKQWP